MTTMLEHEIVVHQEKPLAHPLSQAGIIIPTCNAARHWSALHASLSRQGLEPRQILIIDSSSTDGTRGLARAAGYKVVRIEKSAFSHGGTRQAASAHIPWASILVYLTQDAVLANANAIRHLVQAFDDPSIGAAYGRQLPRPDASPIERHARLFNYPARSSMRCFKDREQIGIKSIFLSNSFAAYRRTALEEVGGFPQGVIIAEDSMVAARLLIAGWCLSYRADAAVVHSHPLSLREEFSRYFDTGVHHARERWILRLFGAAGGEGARFLRSEVSYLLANGPHLLPEALLRTANKLLAYHLGLREHYLGARINTLLSAQPRFWNRVPEPVEHATAHG